MKKILIIFMFLFLLTGCGNKNNELVMVTEAGFAPYEYYEDGKIVGVDVDIANEIAKKMGENFLEIPTQYHLFGITSHPSKLFFPLTALGEEVERIIAGSAIFCYFAVD